MTGPRRYDKPAPGPWVALANCADLPPDLFFPEVGGVGSAVDALAVCHACECQQACLAYAMTSPMETSGIWGGTTPRARRRIRKQRRVSGQVPA